MFSELEKHNFIEYCLEYYPNKGQGCYMYIQIENQEEEQEPIENALPIVLEFFLKENSNIRILGENERTLFFDYLFNDFNLAERNFNDLLMVFKDGKKIKIYK